MLDFCRIGQKDAGPEGEKPLCSGLAKKVYPVYLRSMSKYINPYTDFGFKKLFGEEANKDLLIDFLNQLLPPHHQIAKLQFKNNEKLSDLPDQRKAYFDIHCKSKTGEQFIVEMQKAKMNFFKDRSLFYSTFPIRDQAKRAKHWDFKLNDVYFIAILDFEYDENEERRKFLRHVQLKDQDGDLFYNKLHFKFLQMPLFKKKEHELESHFDKWVYFLKNLSKFERIPAILKEPIFEKAFHTAEMSNMTQAQYEAYERSWLDYSTMNAVVNSAIDQGLEKGIKQGIEKGVEIGREEEKLKSQEEAERKERELILRMHAKGQSPGEIADLTGIEVERIIEIIADIQD